MPIRTWRHDIRDAFVVATSIIFLLPFSTWMSYQPNQIVSVVGWFVINLAMFTGVWFFVASALYLLALPIVALMFQDRRRIWRYGFWAGVWVSSFLAGIALRAPIFRGSIERIGRNAEPLVAAIGRYEEIHGEPPTDLNDLVPAEIDRIPGTGLGVFPEFRYVSGQPDRYDGNPWVLIVIPPSLIMGFDQVLYFPRQNYPEHGYGGSLERIGEWAYVHE